MEAAHCRQANQSRTLIMQGKFIFDITENCFLVDTIFILVLLFIV